MVEYKMTLMIVVKLLQTRKNVTVEIQMKMLGKSFCKRWLDPIKGGNPKITVIIHFRSSYSNLGLKC